MFTNFYLTICVRRSGGDTTIRLSSLMSGASRLATRPCGTNFTEFAAAQEFARRDGGRYHARICDLRFTFLVHRLTSWYKQGTDVERMLIPLSEYMGATGSNSLEKYLAMTPERFRKHLRKLKVNVVKPLELMKGYRAT